MGIGEHCAHNGCGQLDFLPFKCDGCKRTFCLEHRSYQGHSCKAAGKDTQVIVCPICAKSVKIPSSDDAVVSEAFALHSATDCDPANYQRVHNKKKCPALGCKSKLTESNTYTCKKCGKAVCMSHRFEKDHQCPGVNAPHILVAHLELAHLACLRWHSDQLRFVSVPILGTNYIYIAPSLLAVVGPMHFRYCGKVHTMQTDTIDSLQATVTIVSSTTACVFSSTLCHLQLLLLQTKNTFYTLSTLSSWRVACHGRLSRAVHAMQDH